MMWPILITFVIIFPISLTFVIRYTLCITNTGKQRVRLINNWSLGEKFYDYSNEYNEVTFDQHCWELFCFRDPKKLYGPLTQEIWDK